EARTIAEEMRQLGLKQGLEQGLQQALQSQRALLIEQLRVKFGNVDEHVAQLLDAADESALRRYARRIISAATLTEVFAKEV
ncbi:MAG TPA: hypothetical protein VI072_09850, partial [Polyangiaceae bacterium]